MQESVSNGKTLGYHPQGASLVMHLPRSSQIPPANAVVGLYRTLSFVGGVSTGRGQS